MQVIDDEAVDPSRKRNDAKDYMAVPAMTDVAAAVVESDAADSSVDRSGDEAVTADAGCISLPADTDPDASDAPPRNICVGDEISGKGIIAAQDVEPIRAEQAESKPDSGTAPREIASTASGTADAKAAASKQEMYSSPEAVTGASEASGSVQLEGAGDIAAMVKEPDDPIAGKRNKAASRSKHRVFFHFSEVEDGIALGQGDQVEFSTAMNPKTKELNARRIVRVKVLSPRHDFCSTIIVLLYQPKWHTPHNRRRLCIALRSTRSDRTRSL